MLFIIGFAIGMTIYSNNILNILPPGVKPSALDLINEILNNNIFSTFLLLLPIFLNEILERREIYLESMIIRHRNFKDIFYREMKNLIIKNIVYLVISVIFITLSIKLHGESFKLINWNVKESFFSLQNNMTIDNIELTTILFITGTLLLYFLTGFITKLGYFYNRSFFPGFIYCFVIFVLDLVGRNYLKELIFPYVNTDRSIEFVLMAQIILVALIIVAATFYSKVGKERFLFNTIKFKNTEN